MFIYQRLIEHVKACDILSFDSIFASDQLPLYVDFNVIKLLGHAPFGTERAALRDLQVDNPRFINAYEEALCQQLENHNVELRVKLLFQIIESE
jgi:hypothetical protein